MYPFGIFMRNSLLDLKTMSLGKVAKNLSNFLLLLNFNSCILLGVDLKVFYDDLPQKTMELKRYENIALVNEFENACFRLVNFPDSEEITEKYEKLRKKLIDRLSCM